MSGLPDAPDTGRACKFSIPMRGNEEQWDQGGESVGTVVFDPHEG